jgi:hypothetical protein
MTPEELEEVGARVKQAVADAYAEATDEEIREHVEYSIIEARKGLIYDIYEEEGICLKRYHPV